MVVTASGKALPIEIMVTPKYALFKLEIIPIAYNISIMISVAIYVHPKDI